METISQIVGGLIGSSCCAIQLILNALSIGCAGFAVLDPFRPAGLTLMTGSICYTLSKNIHQNNLWDKKSWASIIVSVSLAILPFVIDKINNPRLPSSEEVIEVEVDGIKCLACANSAHNAINSLPGVIDNSLNFEKKKDHNPLHEMCTFRTSNSGISARTRF